MIAERTMPAPKSLSLFTRASIPIRDKSRKSLKHSTLIKARFASPARANYGGEASGESPQITRIKSISEPRLRTKTLRNGALSWASDKCFEFLRLPIAIVIVVRKDGREGEREGAKTFGLGNYLAIVCHAFCLRGAITSTYSK